MNQLWNFLKGKKTYLVMLATVGYGVAGWATGNLTQDAALAFIFGGSGLGALRHGVGMSVTTIAEQLLPAIMQALAAAQKAAPQQAANAGKVAALLFAAVFAGFTLSACDLAPKKDQLVGPGNEAADPLAKLRDATSAALADFSKKTVDDATAAAADAHANNDVVAYTCWDWAITKAGQIGTKNLDSIVGPMSGLQAARDLRRNVVGGVSDDFKVHCYPLIQDEANAIMKGAALVGAGAAGGPAGLAGVGGVLGAAGAAVTGAVLPK